MKLDPAKLAGPLLALLVLAIVLQQTVHALGTSGIWAHRRAAAPAPSPYAQLESLLAAERPATAGARDPFTLAAAPRRSAPRPAPPGRAPERPRVVALVSSGGGASAVIVQWGGRYSTVQESDTLPNGYVVRRITPDEVTLERGSETLVLPVPKKGD